MSKDKGAFVKSPIIIEPCANGSYLVQRGYGLDRPTFLQGDAMAFSNWVDLVAFLSEDYRAANQPPASNGPAS